MIGKLKGTFDGTTPEGHVVLDVSGVGYAVRVRLPTLLALQTRNPETLSLHVHTAVREDAIDLYGFETQDELAFFKQLMSVSGIGPKTALSILNNAEVAALKSAIAQGDAVKLVKVFGVGKKSAERLIVELRDKFTIEVEVIEGGGSDAEVVEALIGLGYSRDEARSAIKEASKKYSKSASARERLALALKYLGSGVKQS